MQHVPSQSANSALAVVINLLDALVEKGVLSKNERISIISDALRDLEPNSTANNESRKALEDLRDARYLQSPNGKA